MTITAPQARNASHLVAHISKMLRQEAPPSRDAWLHLRSLFSGDAAFEVSNDLINLAIAIETKMARDRQAERELRAVTA